MISYIPIPILVRLFFCIFLLYIDIDIYLAQETGGQSLLNYHWPEVPRLRKRRRRTSRRAEGNLPIRGFRV